MADLEHFLSVQEVEVFQSDGTVNLDATLVLDRLPAVCRAFQIESKVDLFSRLKDVVHDTEVDLLLRFTTLPIEDDLV